MAGAGSAASCCCAGACAKVLLTERSAGGEPAAGKAPLQLGFVELDARREVWEYAVLVTSLDAELLTIAQLYRDRGDAENNFDELKNQWGWGGFTTHDVKRCQLMARIVALAANWWNLFVRLADPDRHREAITSRPLLLQAIGRQTQHAGQTTITITSPMVSITAPFCASPASSLGCGKLRSS